MNTSRPSRPWLQAVSNSSVPQSTRTDAELIAAVVAGNDRVTIELYDRLIGVIDKSLFRVFGRREADHDDLVQTTFEQVVLTLARGSYAGNCSLKTWAARISVNVGLNALRSRRRERRVVDHSAEFPLECPANVDVERQSDARAALRVVMAQLAEMNPRRAEAVLLHDIQGYDLGEVATMTSVSVTAAQSRLVRGRRELLKRLDGQQRKRTQKTGLVSVLQGLLGRKSEPVQTLEAPTLESFHAPAFPVKGPQATSFGAPVLNELGSEPGLALDEVGHPPSDVSELGRGRLDPSGGVSGGPSWGRK